MLYIAAKAGIVLLPSTHQLDEEVSEEETSDDEPTLLKWPNKPGIPDSDLFDRDQSWFDGTPEGFSLTVSLSSLVSIYKNSPIVELTSCSFPSYQLLL